MRVLAAGGVGAFFLVGLLVGVRLLALWRRTRRLPELLVGIGLPCLGPVAFTLGIGAARLAPTEPELARVLSALGSASAAIGAGAAAAFTLVVFRHESPGARAAALLLGIGLAACWVGVGWTSGFDVRYSAGAFRYLGRMLRLATFFWASLESLVYWRLMRRRLALGLADPLVTNRFALWGMGLGAGAAGTTIAFLGNLFGARYGGSGLVFEALIAATGLVGAATLFLAFLPPARYQRWLLRRAGAAARPA